MVTRDLAITWERLVRVHRTATAAMDAQLRTEHDRTLDDYDILFQVHSHEGPIRMGDLAQRLLIANSSCSRNVGRLVDDGLLERLPGRTDRREVMVQLTPAGARQWRTMAVTHTRDIERLLDSLTDDDQQQLDRVLQILIEGGNPAPSDLF
jgi:DNA-binding MarR family transcriptional regulator